MLWKGDFVHLCFGLKVFRKNNFVDRWTILWLLLQTLLDDHVKIFRDTLGNRLVFLGFHFFLKLLDILSIVRVLLSANLIHENT